jgi:ABC-2 type transport system ATP-binding protein
MTHLNSIEPLAAAGVRKSFGPACAVDGLDLTVRAGRIAGLVGPNGSGKSTTLRIVAGLLAADEGRLAVAGAPAGSRAARAATGYVPDEPTGLDELTLSEFLRLAAALYGGPPGFAARSAALLAAFGLEERVNARLGSLSHGLRRAAAMTAAFALAPALVVVDEATAALDPEAVVTLRRALQALAARGSGILLATQDLAFAEVVCDEVSLLSRGRLLAHGSPAELRGSFGAATLEDVFLNALGRPRGLDELSGVLGAR